MSQRALQAHADPLLGHTEMDGIGFVVADIVEFGLEYAKTVREDHQHFVEAFREGRIPGVSSS